MTLTVDQTSDVDLLTGRTFDDDAPSKLVAAAGAGDVARFVERLRKWLPAEDAGSNRTEWSRDPSTEPSRTRELFDVVGNPPQSRKKPKRVEVVDGRLVDPAAGAISAWVDALPEDEPPTPIERLLLAELVLEHGRTLPAGDLWRAWRCVVETEPPEDARFEMSTRIEARWLHGLLSFDETARQDAAFRLEPELLEATDTDGTPRAELVPHLDRWLAPFVRCARRALALDLPLFTEEGTDRLHDLVAIAGGMLRIDGRLPHGDRDATELFAAAVEATGWSRKSPVGSLVAELVGTTGRTKKKSKKADPPSVQSDWAHLAHLRCDWSPDSDSLLVANRGAETSFDLAVLGHRLLTGTWGLSVSLDGKPVGFDDRWDCVCWSTDDEVDYAELQFVVDENTRIERQLLLPRGDRCAILADVVSAADGVTIDYESRLPLAAGLEARADVDTRECSIHARKRAARVFPLALPQDRVQGASGWFGPDEGELRLEQASVGGLYAPVVLDWAPERMKSLADWTTLTVSEAGRSVGPETAAGARLRVGPQQLLLYRSHRLGTTARAVLGLHTPRETVVARVPEESGELETLLHVD